ncbi:DNA-deoxyinosine glycosylase [Paenibacillus sp. N1-5-1-14]|uniref:DNA-deoxyinosine glycosylase n=1 Tax=Paenibacillus radicibacter TaxID=2972488 RepID=UPI0021596841|nr:DNA-deoxyinosine glycosylase [Paenibacillus radicibacter]MCR8643662.1 DNA-deoxyinosine glycosylase [Paenibacillus radicibacter]
MLSSFPPVIHEQCSILILGSMPGAESLRLQQYYAHPRNHFWKIIFHMFNGTVPEEYESRLAFSQSKGIALWDVLQYCEREGSLDVNIQKPVANNFAELLATYPNIRHLCFNGGKAYDLFKRHVQADLDLDLITLYPLPSSSPAHTISMDKKLKSWSVIGELAGKFRHEENV